MKPSHKLDTTMWKQLSEQRAISGFEHRMHEVVLKYLKPCVDDIHFDRLQSIVGVQKANNASSSIMFSAHMDEVGFQVKEILPSGFLLLQAIGGWWSHVLLAHEFLVETREHKTFHGVIGSMPPHSLGVSEKKQVLPLDHLYLDLGVASAQEVCDLGIRVGDPITPATNFRIMNNPNYLFSKAWDDRSCLAIALELAKRLANQTCHVNVQYAGTSQEEVGQRGARSVAHKMHPDIHIALDVTNAQDTPLEQGEVVLGQGPVITIMDASSIAHYALLKRVEETARKHQIPIQYSCSKTGGTDNGNVHKSLKGIMGMTISLPSRYMHSSSSIVHTQDVLHTITLLEQLCLELSDTEIEKLRNYNR